MLLFTGPYALAAIADAIQSVQLTLACRLVTRPNPTHLALSVRRIKRTASAIVSHEGTELVNEALEDAPARVLDHLSDCLLISIILYCGVLAACQLRDTQHRKDVQTGPE